MTPAKSMIVFGEDWNRHPSSTQHLVSRLAREREVLWVNSIGMRRPRLNRSDLSRVGAKLGSMMGRGSLDTRDASEPSVRPRVVSARAISWPGSSLAALLNRSLVPASLAAHRNALGPGKPIVWASLPTVAPFVDRLDASAIIYYAGDDFSALAGVDHEPVCRMERELAGKADLVIAASQAIAARLPSHKTRVLEHGCDLDLFSDPVGRASDLPEDGPVAGFYGSISDWIDVELIAETAKRMPDWRFMLIGEVRCNVSALTDQSNVILAGPRPHGKLAGYSQHWNASLLPFRDNRQIAACNPLKLREYLAAGSPILSSVAFTAMQPYRHLISVASGPAATEEGLRASLRESSGLRQKRREAVATESWEARSATVSEWLDDLT